MLKGIRRFELSASILAMRMYLSVFLLGLFAVVASCRKDDIRTAAIHVPAMQGMECAEIIIKELEREQTVLPTDVEVILERRMLYVRYDSLDRSVKNIEYTIAKTGFDANEVPADPEAMETLPEDCRPSSQVAADASNSP